MSGIFWLAFLFILCFAGVHIVRLARMSWQFQKGRGDTAVKKAPSADDARPRETPGQQNGPVQAPPLKERRETPPPQTAQPSPEPVYYIVERKRKRSRDSYSAPKEIKFK